MTHPLVEAMRKCVPAYPKPCVNISGGIDSTIILHHLNEKATEPIYTYTVGFKGQPTEFLNARRVADYYDTIHREVLIENMLDTYPLILQHFKQPRFNLWPYWLAKQAVADGRISCYIGEGGDEHFGGYWYKPLATYEAHWADFFTYVYSTYKTIYGMFPSLNLLVPMHPSMLPTELTRHYYDPQQGKKHLRKIYRGILPDFVVEQKKLNCRKDYWVMWNQELKPYFPGAQPRTEDDIRELWNAWVYREWLKVRQLESIAQTCNP